MTFNMAKTTLKIIIIVLCFGTLLPAQITPGINSFNCGEVCPELLLRYDFGKYNNAVQKLQNMLILSQGPVVRRPGTKFISEVKDSNNIVRLIPFEYSKTDAYVLEFGPSYMRVYRNGGHVLDVNNNIYEISTKFEQGELYDIQYVQNANTMYLVDGNDPPQKLTRSSHYSWEIEDVNFVTGPFLGENTTNTSITPSDVNGTIHLAADANIFASGHIGSLWQIGHRRAVTSLKGKADHNDISNTISCGGDYLYNIQGDWIGTVTLERSYDAGVSWEAVHPRFNNSDQINEDYPDTETENGVIYRVAADNVSSGSATYNFTVYDYIDYGIVRITAYNSPNDVNALVLSELTATTATTKWSEGAWSDYRGWPQTIEFHEQRLMFGGSENYPQTIWATKTAKGDADDYENMTEGIDDDDSLIYVLPGQNPVQWMLSQTYLLIGTLSGVGRWGSAEDSSPITPTQPTNYRIQSRNGASYLQATLVGDDILYVERGGHRVRQFSYNLERDKFIAPDVTVLASHIASTGIKNISCQNRPDTLLWCVLNDGNIATLTYKPEQDVIGWSRIVTDDDFECSCIVPGSDEDEVWVIVKRNINNVERRYVEQFQPQDWGNDQNDCYFVDSGLTWDGGAAVDINTISKAYPCVVTVNSWPVSGDDSNLANGNQVKITAVSGMTQLNNKIYTVADVNISALTFSLKSSNGTIDINSVNFTTYTSGGSVRIYENTFTNLSHLEGETLSVFADGEAIGNETVSDSNITIDKWSNKVTVGLPYTSIVETMPYVFNTQGGSTAGSKMRISNVLVNFYKTLGVQYGKNSSTLSNVTFRETGSDISNTILLYTGWIPLPFLHGHYQDATIYFSQTQPLPFCIRAIMPRIEINE